MKRRQLIQTTGGIVCLGLVGVRSASAGTLVNATVNSDGSIVATDDDFVIAGQSLTVDDENSYGIYNDGYSGEIYNNTINVPSLDGTTYGVRVEDGAVDVTNNTVNAATDLSHQFIAIGFTAGATGHANENALTGRHRVGVLVTGAGTDVSISRNEIVGSGPQDTGWADNGVQISGGATGSVKDNTIDGHWWSLDNFVSSGLLAFSDDVVAQRNHFGNNDLGVGFIGDHNNVIHNTVEVTYTSTDTEHFGVYELGGEDNGIRQNSITTEDPDDGLVGIIVLGDNAKLIGNELSGWQDSILDAGDDTKLPDPFEPDS